MSGARYNQSEVVGYLGSGGEMRTTKIEEIFNGRSGRLARCCELWIAVE